MSELAEAIADLKDDDVREIVQDKISSGADPMSIMEECRKGMDIVGERYKNKEYFLGELIISGEIFKEAMATVEPRLTYFLKRYMPFIIDTVIDSAINKTQKR